MAPKVDLAALKAIDATAATQAVERKKKRQAVEVGQYELRGLKKGPQTESTGHETSRTEVEATLKTPRGGFLTGVPLAEVVGVKTVVIV